MRKESELAVPSIPAVPTAVANAVAAPAASANVSANANRKQTQKWMNVGIIYDSSKITETSDAGFCAIGIGTPMDDLKNLRDKTVRGSKDARAVYNSLFDMHQAYLNELKEPGQSEYAILGSAIEEESRKANLIEFLKACGLKAEDIEKAAEFAFPKNSPVWAIQYHRQKAKAAEADEPRAPFSFGGTKFKKAE